jgi:thiamine biosynthesis protein ThiC
MVMDLSTLQAITKVRRAILQVPMVQLSAFKNLEKDMSTRWLINPLSSQIMTANHKAKPFLFWAFIYNPS